MALLNDGESESPLKSGVDGLLQQLQRCGVQQIPELKVETKNILGKGQFGTVYAGWLGEQKVAVKSIKLNAKVCKEGLEELKSEVMIASQAAKHGSHVCAPLGVTQRQRCRPEEMLIAWELCEGGDLCELINGTGVYSTVYDPWVPLVDGSDATALGALYTEDFFNEDHSTTPNAYTLPTALRRHYAREIACVLVQLERAGVVHRDIKPPNLLLGQEVKVLEDANCVAPMPRRLVCGDFGIAFLRDSEESLSEFSQGTRGYMAPECELAGHKVGPPADMFAAGVTLLELWCGSVWSSYGIAEDDVRAALAKVKAAEPAMAALLERCISSDPGKRPVPAALASALEQLFHDEVEREAADTKEAKAQNASDVEEVADFLGSLKLSEANARRKHVKATSPIKVPVNASTSRYATRSKVST